MTKQVYNGCLSIEKTLNSTKKCVKNMVLLPISPLFLSTNSQVFQFFLEEVLENVAGKDLEDNVEKNLNTSKIC